MITERIAEARKAISARSDGSSMPSEVRLLAEWYNWSNWPNQWFNQWWNG